MKWKLVGTVVLCALVFAGCASSRSGKVYSRAAARVPHEVEWGTVEAVNEATIEGTKTPIGTVAGAIMGGVLGHAVGGGSGQQIATAAGALGGAAAGAVGEEKITRKKALEITVKLDSGKVTAIVQEADEAFAAGERVRVLTGPDGTKRVRH
jgi:outer membrane lipoprotein SlyB